LLEELSLECNKLIRPLLDFRSIIRKTNFSINSVTSSGKSDFVKTMLHHSIFLISCTKVLSLIIYSQLYCRAMSELQVLRLFGNPLEFLPEILPLKKLRHLSLANIRIEATENLKTVSVEIEVLFSLNFLNVKQNLT
jgi:hypothetical protein